MSILLELAEEPDATRGADWLELSCFQCFPQSISKSMIEHYFERLHFDDYELVASDIFQHIEWRSRLCKNYPFNYDNGTLEAVSSFQDSIEYSFPLLLSTHDMFSTTTITNWSVVGDLFELFCAASLQVQIGASVLIGNPLGGFSATFDECLHQVSKILNERKGPKHPKASQFQDAGVDIIAWRNFDSRKGQVVFLTQCASGKNWRKKGGDIVPRLWNQLMFWTVEPVKILTFPYSYDFDSPQAEIDWFFYAYDSGLLFDRLRISNFNFVESKYDFELIKKWMKIQETILSNYES